MTNHTTPKHSTLGKNTRYDRQYDATLLFPITRKTRRNEIGLSDKLPFSGFDIWNHYEVSWLNNKGKPMVALAEIIYSADSENIIESKSMKLYFNSFNNMQFKDVNHLQKMIDNDLRERLQASFITVHITPLSEMTEKKLFAGLDGINIDTLDIDCSVYHADAALLTTENNDVEETLCSDLLKSNCLVTNQPDWCSVQITYKGNKINRAGLLRYIVSFRNDNEFHEQCIEKIFMQIMQQCKPTELTVYGRSTRRGGIDINAYRSTKPISAHDIANVRLCRQ